MKKIEINAYSFEEAKKKASEMGINVVRNVTPSYKKEKPTDFDAFAERMLKKHNLDEATGVGLVVVKEAGSTDTRERPYEFINNVTEGTMTKTRTFQIKKVSDGSVLAEALNKSDAAKAAKALMRTVKEDLVCTQVYKVAEPHYTAFHLNYVPSANTKLGTYVVFGN